jgi:predicted Zn-dependent peptidase
MRINRRDAAKGLLAGIAANALPLLPAYAHADYAACQTFTLGNGLRTHYIANRSGYIAAALVLRSKEITHNGLAHMFEHTSCSGAAGSMSADDNARLQRIYIQDGNATTQLGALKWYAGFLPQNLPKVIALLADISLDQKFGLDTVATQARVVLEELYLEKYTPDKLAQCKLERELFGNSHPYAKDTMEEEIARCKLRPATLATQLRDFAAAVRLPANMDLFLVGALEPADLESLVAQHFGRFPFAAGPRLDIPPVAVTRTYRGLVETSRELQRPMADLRLAWNTGVCIASNEAATMLALSEYLAAALFDELREKDGDTYTPDVRYEPDGCSGVFRISISSSKDLDKVERRVFDVIDMVRAGIDAGELDCLSDRLLLKRCKEANDNEITLDCLVERTLDGASLHDVTVENVTSDGVLAAARRHLPSHRRAYVSLVLQGQ